MAELLLCIKQSTKRHITYPRNNSGYDCQHSRRVRCRSTFLCHGRIRIIRAIINTSSRARCTLRNDGLIVNTPSMFTCNTLEDVFMSAMENGTQ